VANLFITATGTDIGKTYITCQIARYLNDTKQNYQVLKPIISGFEGNKTDTHKLANISGQTIAQTSLYKLKAALSPDVAAKQEGVEINYNKIIDFCKPKANQYNIVEGVGGVYVPIDGEHTILDLIKDLNYKTILIVGNYLGSISHTLSAYNNLKAVNITPVIIINETNTNPPCSTDEMMESIKNHVGCDVFNHKLGGYSSKLYQTLLK